MSEGGKEREGEREGENEGEKRERERERVRVREREREREDEREREREREGRREIHYTGVDYKNDSLEMTLPAKTSIFSHSLIRNRPFSKRSGCLMDDLVLYSYNLPSCNSVLETLCSRVIR